MAKVRNLSDDVLAALPNFPGGAPMSIMAASLRTSWEKIKAAYEKLDEADQAILVRNPPRGAQPGYVLYPLTAGIRRCIVCRKPFELPPKSKRKVCSASCRSKGGWADPVKAAQRRKNISEAAKTPTRRAAVVKANKERWARPGEREKLAAANRERWKDPVYKAVISSKIRVHHQQPEVRAFYSMQRKKDWARPEYAEMMKAKSAASSREQDRRAASSKRLKERWKDPVMREKYTRANANRNNPELRKKNAERTKAYWADPERAAAARAKIKEALARPEYRAALRARMIAAHKDKKFRKKYLAGLKKGAHAARGKAVATRKARGWWKKDRPAESPTP